MMKSNNFRQKASIIRKSEGKNSKYKPYSCYPFATRGILRTQANIFKKTKKSLNCAKQTNRKLKSMLAHINNKSFSTYVKDIAEKFRKDSSTGFTQVTYEALHDIPKNCHTVSQNGYRHSKLLQAFSVLTYNNSTTCSEFLHENLPMLFCSPSLVLKRRMPKHSPFLTLPGILTDEALVKRHFERFGCSFKGNLGPLQFGQNSTRVRELVKASTSAHAMIGFKAFINECKEWQFYVTPRGGTCQNFDRMLVLFFGFEIWPNPIFLG